jgi:hypothetical protein
MPKNLLKENVNIGEVAFSWEFKEYEQYERGGKWYLIMSIIAILLILFAVLSGNYLFALIVVLFVIIMFLQNLQHPLPVEFGLTDNGIVLGNKFYSYRELDKFWLLYSPPAVQMLYFEPKTIVRHRLSVPLPDIDPSKVRDFLNQFLTEDLEQEEEPFSERLSRILKIQ